MNKYILLTPGPTPLPPSVSEAMAQPILHHRTKDFGDIFEFVRTELQYVFRTKNTMLIMTSSGSGAMESSVANLLSPGDKSLVYSTGLFGDRFVNIHKAYGLAPVVLAQEWGHAADPEKLRAALKKETGVKAVYLQHTDTSTGIVNDLKKLADVVRSESDALVVVDAISGLAAEPLETDGWGLDVVLSGSQKGLMNAPGLAFVSVGERAWKSVEEAQLPRFYFDWRTMRESLAKKETPYTPGVTLFVGQAEALRLIRKEGIENVWKRTSELAAYARAEGKKLGLTMFSKDPATILTALNLPPDVDGKRLIAEILDEEKISIAGGQLQLQGKIIRVAHMGYINKKDLDAGFAALSKRLAPARA